MPRAISSRLAVAVAPMLLLFGCGDGTAGRAPLHQATGKVSSKGEPAPGVEVRLYDASKIGDLDALRPFATTREDGTFRLGTYEKDDGAPEGTYKVTLFWPDRPPGLVNANDQLGGRYTDPAKSTLEVKISAGENAIPPFEVEKSATVARPQKKQTKNTKADPDGLN